ncbi:MAG TPA: GNAT family N-acetyltransferase [Blastocatellia bacterium]|nr:GNAT family N-acetyltransferase [Blastocatellia bacterium]
MNANLTIRPCATLPEFEQCIQLQQAVWGDNDRDLIPQHIFVVAVKTGGQVLGAYDGAQLIGYVMSLVAKRGAETFLHSHMAGVLPAYQNRGVGRQLKLAQREDALARGFRLIEWTFDPLKLRNAYFNLVRLGAVVRTYLPNVYGQVSSHLDAGRPTDRLLAEWWIAAPRVEKILAGQPYVPDSRCERILVPAEEQTIAVQTNVRQQFQALLAQGYTATGVELQAGGMAYLLESPQYFSI